MTALNEGGESEWGRAEEKRNKDVLWRVVFNNVTRQMNRSTTKKTIPETFHKQWAPFFSNSLQRITAYSTLPVRLFTELQSNITIEQISHIHTQRPLISRFLVLISLDYRTFVYACNVYWGEISFYKPSRGFPNLSCASGFIFLVVAVFLRLCFTVQENK